MSSGGFTTLFLERDIGVILEPYKWSAWDVYTKFKIEDEIKCFIQRKVDATSMESCKDRMSDLAAYLDSNKFNIDELNPYADMVDYDYNGGLTAYIPTIVAYWYDLLTKKANSGVNEVEKLLKPIVECLAETEEDT